MKKIVFDLDNTLLFLSSNWEVYYQKFLDKHHFPVSPKVLYSTIGNIEKKYPDKLVTKDFFIHYLNEELSIFMTEEILQDFFEMYAEIPLLKLEEVLSLLKYLSSKYELIAYSNWFVESQILRLKKNHMYSFFKEIYGCDIVPIKPSKRGIERIIGKDKKEDYLFIGDNIEYDIKMPDSLGIDTIFYNRNHIIQEQYPEIFHIEDLMSLL